MATVFKPRRTGTASKVPTTSDLADGEIAVNYADKKVYLRSGSSIVEVANAASAGSAAWGNITGTLSSQTDLSNALAGKATSAQGDKADSAIQPDTNASLATLTLSDPTADVRINLNQHSDGSYLGLTVSGDDDSHSGNIGFYEYGGSARGYFLQISKSDLSATFSGNIGAPRIRLSSTTDASLSSTDHAFQIGDSSGANLIMDGNEIMARNNGATSGLYIQNDGGLASFGGDVLVSGDFTQIQSVDERDITNIYGSKFFRFTSSSAGSPSSSGAYDAVGIQIVGSGQTSQIVSISSGKWYGITDDSGGFSSPKRFIMDDGHGVALADALKLGSGETLTKISIGTSTPSSLDDGELYLEY